MKPKFSEFEFWPYWLFYTPFVPYWIWNSIKSGSFSYFCKVNPGIQFGGALDYSKFEVLNQLPAEVIPKTYFLKHKNEGENLLSFPFIVKPDFGERGVNVELISTEKEWKNYPLNENLIIQEYIDLPLEFGIFYVRHPHSKVGEILSITGKEFLEFHTDGKTKLKEFVENNPRAFARKKHLSFQFQSIWNEILPKGKTILLEPIGNHNRGTRFYDASYLLSEELFQKTSDISENIAGFFYGRFDVKAQSIEDFQKGKFIVLEVNGSSSEPTHIYDSKFNLKQAYKEVKRHLDCQYEIAQTQTRTYSPILFYKALLKRIFLSK